MARRERTAPDLEPGVPAGEGAGSEGFAEIDLDLRLLRTIAELGSSRSVASVSDGRPDHGGNLRIRAR